ncbi:MAG: CDP-alcohol phosphatidyltransferase family protein [Candidatus Poseidoniaceae archaeon]
MKSTFRLTGIADYITLTNAMFGTASIMFLVLAVEDMSQPFGDGLKSKYIWASMLCIFLSALGDIIDGPIARRYSKQKLLGGSLDIMSDCLSFCVAPALMMFIMFGRWGEATPIWTISLALAGFWIIGTGMLRLARFQHEEGSGLPYFHGLSSPGNAILLMSTAGFIWLQPILNFGPDLTHVDICLGEGQPCHATPGLDMFILPVMFISGAMMISDRRLSKLKHGLDLKLSILQMACLLTAILYAMIRTGVSDNQLELGSELAPPGWLFLASCLFAVYYLAKPQPPVFNPENEEE